MTKQMADLKREMIALMRYYEKQGWDWSSAMEFTFTDIQRNIDLSPSIFQFVLPPGVEVIQQ